MIEKILKAVKSSSKKRGRNITVGVVVGFLLSCTAVMGVDENYLLIKKEGEEIKFSTDNGTTAGIDNPYEENTWDGTEYVNNRVLNSTSTDYGLKLEGNLGNVNFINNGSITATGSSSSYGIYNDSTMGTLTNNGIITATGSGSSYGIYNGYGAIGTLTNNGIITGTSTGGYGYGIYNEGGTIGTLTNNGIIAGTTSININSYGIYNGYGAIGTLTNNGIITGTSTSGGYGIYNDRGTIGTLTNNGIITGTSSTSIYNYNSTIEILLNNRIITGATSTRSYGYGIYNDRGTIGTLTNNGVITRATSTNRNGYGIYNEGGTIGTLTNNGVITGTSTSGLGYGIYNNKNYFDTTIEILLNNGTITGTSTSGNGYGIYNKENASIPAVENTGIIYGKTNAVFNGGGETGKVKRTNNYGLLISGSTDVVDGISIVAHDAVDNDNEIKNYGLAFTDDGSGSYKNHGASNANHNFGKTQNATIDGAAYKIRNVKADVNSTGGAITNIKSFKIEGGELYSDTTKINDSNSTSNVILNGITDTLLVSTGENKLDNSVINAYGTAVKFDETNSGKLTLSGTTVNGGVKDGTAAISGSDDSSKTDALVLENSVVNGNIDMKDGNDELTIGAGSIVNGKLDGGTGDDTLNFGSAVTRTVVNDGINIQHNISGFENMNINTNVTLFEKTIAADGSVADLQVTGVTDVTIGAKGVLTLRIDSANGNKHALSSTGSTGTIKSENGGKLLLALNGAGLRETISFGNLTLDGSLVTGYEGEYQEDVTFETTSVLHSVKRTSGTNEVEIEAKKNLPSRPNDSAYEKLNKIYQSLCSPLVNGLENFNVDDDEKLSTFLSYLNDIYAGNPYSYSSELSRKSAGMFRDIVTENIFKPETNKWMIYGGLTHVDGGTKDTYYGKGYYTYDIGSSNMDADTKITGAYMLGEYGVSDTLTSGVVIGGNKLKSDLSNGSKVDGSALYLGAYAKKYIGNLKVTAGAGFQYGDYDADRIAVNRVASDSAEPVMKYSDNYNDITYDIYLNGRYSHNIGDNLFLEPYGTLSYTYIDQDGANEGGKTLAIETDSKSFDYTVGKVGVDLKKVIPHEKGKSTLSAGVSYTKILDGADEEHITGRFKGGSDFDILVAHKNEHSIGLNAKYALELENGVLFDVKGTYSVERDSNNNSGKNKTKGEWIVGAGIGYKF